MVHSYSPSHRELAVPGIGFPQNISIAADMFDLEGFRGGRTTKLDPWRDVDPAVLRGLHLDGEAVHPDDAGPAVVRRAVVQGGTSQPG